MEIDKKDLLRFDKSYFKQEKVINYTPTYIFNEKTRTLDIVEWVDDKAAKELGKDLSFKEQVARLGLSASLKEFEKSGIQHADFNDTTIISNDINVEWAKAKAQDAKVAEIKEKIKDLENSALKQEQIKQEQNNNIGDNTNGKQEQ